MQPSHTPTADRYYRPELDVLRCLAFLMIFAHHSLNTSRVALVSQVAAIGTFGVQLFFLLSSFLITELLLREREMTGTIRLRAFYARRILRIWPLYFAFLGTIFILSHIFPMGLLTWGKLAAFVLLAGNWYVHAHGWLRSVAGPLWSISIEEQFYLMWPFVMRAGNRGAAWGFSLLFLVGAAVALLVDGRLPVPHYTFTANSFVEFGFFALGAMLALLLHHRDLAWPTTLRVLACIAGFSLLAVAANRFHIANEVTTRSDLLVGFALLGLAMALIFRSVLGVSVPKAAAPLVSLGRISYGLYVVHLACFSAAWKTASRLHHGPFSNLQLCTIAAIGLLLTIATAMLSYRVLERPFLQLKQRFTVVPNRIDWSPDGRQQVS